MLEWEGSLREEVGGAGGLVSEVRWGKGGGGEEGKVIFSMDILPEYDSHILSLSCCS